MSNSIVSVEIAGQRYPVRSNLDATYVAELASYVEQKMRAAADAVPASDMLGLAVLVALNLADECFRARQQQSSTSGEVHERALRIERLVDDALGSFPDSRRAGHADR
jgi:cell division protein ZapA